MTLHQRSLLPSLSFCLLAFFTFSARCMNVVPTGPCAAVCNSKSATVDSDIVCYDSKFGQNNNRTDFRACLECELNSPAVDSTRVSDVTWGLCECSCSPGQNIMLIHLSDNLRYAVSTCMFGFPSPVVAQSTPCDVSCAPLQYALGSQLTGNSTIAAPGMGFCTTSRFDDNTINVCSQCYGRLNDQVAVANCEPFRSKTFVWD